MNEFMVDFSILTWNSLAAITDILMVVINVILIISIIIGYKSIKESILSRDASLLTWAMERMSLIKEDINIIRNAKPYGTLETIKSKNFISPWEPKIEDAANRVSIELQRLAYLVNSGMISKIHFRKMWGPYFIKAWDVLEIWIKHKRFTNHEPIELESGAYSRNDFEKFAIECKKIKKFN